MSQDYRQDSKMGAAADGDALNDLDSAPPSFEFQSGQRAVFVDFTTANYDITFDVNQQSAFAESEIHFRTEEAGFPTFDMLPNANTVEVNGLSTNAVRQSSPDNVTSFRRLTRELPAGEHVMRITHQIPGGAQTTGEGVRWYSRPRRVSCMFTMTDYNRFNTVPEAGGFLERYLPANLEFDRFQMKFDVKVINTTRTHRLFTNVDVDGQNEWRFELPSFYTASCPWFHLVADRDVGVQTDTYTSIDGREIPVIVYASRQFGWQNRVAQFMQEALRATGELESRHGPFPHPRITVLAVGGGGGMEYAGATRTGFGALEHELNHSYFARNIVPADGDSGWVDEAIASWGDAGNPSTSDLPANTANMGNRSPYRRRTHYNGYSQGAELIAHLDFRCAAIGGMAAVLKTYFARKQGASATSIEFQKIVEEELGESLQDLFDTYVYGRGDGGGAPAAATDGIVDDPKHPHGASIEDLASELFPDD